MPKSITDYTWSFAWNIRPFASVAVILFTVSAITVSLGLEGQPVGGLAVFYGSIFYFTILYPMSSVIIWVCSRYCVGGIVQDYGTQPFWYVFMILAGIGPLALYSAPDFGRIFIPPFL